MSDSSQLVLHNMLKKILLVLCGSVLVLVVALLIGGFFWQAPGDELIPAGFKQNTSYYIDMPDGTRIAADLWLPPNLEPDQKVPTVIEGTRYWREMGLTLLGRVAAFTGRSLPGVHPTNYNAYFPSRGYAVLTIDVRGTGASSGVHTTEYSLEEKEDYRHIIEWVTQQTWSSGDVFAVGISYSGTSAELMATSQHPGLKAVAPLYSDFDVQMHLATPGGLYQPAFIESWSELVGAMDRNDICGVITASNATAQSPGCRIVKLLMSGVKPVAGEEGFLPTAIASHNSPVVKEMVRQLPFRDSTWGATEVTPSENSPFGLKSEIERSNVPMFVVTGWFDAATTNGALARFASFDNIQEVWVGAFSHGGSQDTDPYKNFDTPSMWTKEQQLDKVLAFFERYRTDREANPIVASTLNYYVNGSGTFKQTSQWPPQHLNSQTFYFGPDSTLVTKLPRARGFDPYQVTAESATAETSRWKTQLGGGDVIYNRRAEMSQHSLNYTSAAFDQDMELTGSVVLDLWMTSDGPEGALFAYLEDVAPNGEVKYLTEGVLNLLHRNNTKNPAYPMFGPTHSFLQKDASPMPTRQLFSYSTTLYSTSVLIKQGHKLRLSLAGGDATSFVRLPVKGPLPKWHVYSGPTSPSAITIHLAPWE